MRALVLEGGGMRGAYTSGVLEAFAEASNGAGIYFDHIVSCSAGACNAASYLAGQAQRNRRIYLDYVDGDKLVRLHRFLTGGDIMDVDYLIDEVTLKLCPLDFKALVSSRTRLHIGVTDAVTGEPRYYNNHEDELTAVFRATCALPFFYRSKAMIAGRRYVDGGVADPVPVTQAIRLGATDIIVVLTSAIEGRGVKRLRIPGIERLFSSSPAVRQLLRERYQRYKEASELLSSPPEGVGIRVVRPSQPLEVKRTTTERSRLEATCDLGLRDGRSFLNDAC